LRLRPPPGGATIIPTVDRLSTDAVAPAGPMGRTVTTEDLESTYWFCVDHHAVEEFAGCGSHNRIGPFPTRAAAADALQTIAARERRYDAEDAAWDGDG
jgi:hypothetical protein